jgi:hypothetical protein
MRFRDAFNYIRRIYESENLELSNWKVGNPEVYSWKKFDFFLVKNRYLLIPSPPRTTSKLKERPSAIKRELSALKNMNFLNLFSSLWVILCPPGSGSTDLIESGSSPDSKHCLIRIKMHYG